MIQEPTDYFLMKFRPFDKMEIFLMMVAEYTKLTKDELTEAKISYGQGLEFMNVNKIKIGI